MLDTTRTTSSPRSRAGRWTAGVFALALTFSVVGCAHLEERHEAHKRMVENAVDRVEQKLDG